MITLALVVTTACPLDCKHCLRGDTEARHLPFDVVEKAVGGAKKFGIDSIHVTGGEPFLYDRLADLFKLARDHKIPLTFSSNGLLLEKNSDLIERHKDLIRQVNISLESRVSEIHDAIRGEGAFKRVLEAFDFCRRHKVPFGINTCLNKLNSKNFADIVRFARSQKALQAIFTTVLPCTNAKANDLILGEPERKRAYQELLRLGRLSALDIFRLFYVPVYVAESIFASGNIIMCRNQSLQIVTVDVDGSIHFCCFLTQYDVSTEVAKRIRIANLKDISFEEGVRLFSEAIGRFHAERIGDFCRSTSDRENLDFNSCFYCSRKLGL